MRTILVVDDDPWVRVLARDVLVTQGLKPTGPVITKPFTIEYLARRVGMVLNNRRPAAAPARAQ